MLLEDKESVSEKLVIHDANYILRLLSLLEEKTGQHRSRRRKLQNKKI